MSDKRNLIDLGNEALFELRTSRPTFNNLAAFFGYKKEDQVSKPKAYSGRMSRAEMQEVYSKYYG